MRCKFKRVLRGSTRYKSQQIWYWIQWLQQVDRSAPLAVKARAIRLYGRLPMIRHSASEPFPFALTSVTQEYFASLPVCKGFADSPVEVHKCTASGTKAGCGQELSFI